MYRYEERATYSQLKEAGLDCYFDFCRDSGLKNRWTQKQVLTRVAYSFEDGLRPTENIMWLVILLVLSGGWLADWEASTRASIADSLAEKGLDNLLIDVPTDEAELFRHDLSILKLA